MTTPPIHLDVQTVARAALKAYEEGRLSAQGPTPACRYRDASGRPCAIGAAIPDDVAAEWDRADNGESAAMSALVAGHAVSVNGYINICDLQGRHDYWTANTADSDREQAFVTLCRELAGVETTEQEVK